MVTADYSTSGGRGGGYSEQTSDDVVRGTAIDVNKLKMLAEKMQNSRKLQARKEDRSKEEDTKPSTTRQSQTMKMCDKFSSLTTLDQETRWVQSSE